MGWEKFPLHGSGAAIPPFMLVRNTCVICNIPPLLSCNLFTIELENSVWCEVEIIKNIAFKCFLSEFPSVKRQDTTFVAGWQLGLHI